MIKVIAGESVCMLPPGNPAEPVMDLDYPPRSPALQG
jgi:hypothetical protein